MKKNNRTVALNILYIKKKQICTAYISKIYSNSEKQLVFLMAPNEEEGCYYLAVKKLSALLRGITSKHDGEFYCLSCFHSFRKENKLISYENVCKKRFLWNCNAVKKE